MRNVPYYQEIIVTDENLPTVKKLLKEVDNRFDPYLIDLLNIDESLSIMKSIQNFLELKITDFNFPYPIYFLSRYIPKGSLIKTFQRRIDIPNFYFNKEKRTTRIHTNVSRLNISAEKTLEYDDRLESYKRIQDYAKNNKKVHLLNNENQYLKNLLTSIENYHGNQKTEKE